MLVLTRSIIFAQWTILRHTDSIKVSLQSSASEFWYQPGFQENRIAATLCRYSFHNGRGTDGNHGNFCVRPLSCRGSYIVCSMNSRILFISLGFNRNADRHTIIISEFPVCNKSQTLLHILRTFTFVNSLSDHSEAILLECLKRNSSVSENFRSVEVTTFSIFGTNVHCKRC